MHAPQAHAVPARDPAFGGISGLVSIMLVPILRHGQFPLALMIFQAKGMLQMTMPHTALSASLLSKHSDVNAPLITGGSCKQQCKRCPTRCNGTRCEIHLVA